MNTQHNIRGGVIDFLASLPLIMQSFEETYAEPLEVISVLQLMVCNMRHETARTLIKPEDEPSEEEVLVSQYSSGIPPQEVNVNTTPVLQTDKYIFDESSVYFITEEVGLLKNPLPMPMAYPLGTVQGHVSLGRAMTHPDGKTFVGI